MNSNQHNQSVLRDLRPTCQHQKLNNHYSSVLICP